MSHSLNSSNRAVHLNLSPRIVPQSNSNTSQNHNDVRNFVHATPEDAYKALKSLLEDIQGRALLFRAVRRFLMGFGVNSIFVIAQAAIRLLYPRNRGKRSIQAELRSIAKEVIMNRESALLGGFLSSYGLIYQITKLLLQRGPTTSGSYIVNAAVAGAVAGSSIHVLSPAKGTHLDPTALSIHTLVRAVECSARRWGISSLVPNASSYIFVVSCWLIMYSWFYHPNSLSPSYAHWITRMAEMDTRLLQLLRNIREGRLKYGRRSAFLADYCRDNHINPALADLSTLKPISCCVIHPLDPLSGVGCCQNAARRAWRGFLQGMALYTPIQAIAHGLVHRRALCRPLRPLPPLISRSHLRSLSEDEVFSELDDENLNLEVCVRCGGYRSSSPVSDISSSEVEANSFEQAVSKKPVCPCGSSARVRQKKKVRNLPPMNPIHSIRTTMSSIGNNLHGLLSGKLIESSASSGSGDAVSPQFPLSGPERVEKFPDSAEGAASSSTNLPIVAEERTSSVPSFDLRLDAPLVALPTAASASSSRESANFVESMTHKPNLPHDQVRTNPEEFMSSPPVMKPQLPLQSVSSSSGFPHDMYFSASEAGNAHEASIASGLGDPMPLSIGSSATVPRLASAPTSTSAAAAANVTTAPSAPRRSKEEKDSLDSPLKRLRFILWLLMKSGIAAARSSSFLGMFIGLVWGGVCFARRILPHNPHETTGPMLGSFLSGFSILIEHPNRRAELASYVAPRAIQTAWDLLEKKKIVRSIPGSHVTIFSFAMALLMAVFEDSRIRRLRSMINNNGSSAANAVTESPRENGSGPNNVNGNNTSNEAEESKAKKGTGVFFVMPPTLNSIIELLTE